MPAAASATPGGAAVPGSQLAQPAPGLMSVRAAAGQAAAALSAAARPPGIPAAQPVRPKAQHLLRVDDQGREIDEHGNPISLKVDAVTSLKVGPLLTVF